MRDLPYSNMIEPYLEAISGCDAFFVAERDYGRIINYRHLGSDVFPDPASAPDPHTAYLWGLRRQCRGLVFDLDGNVIGPGFEKFMNVNETEETRWENIDLSQPHVICQKLDGSMCRPVIMPDGGYRIFTKMGLTEVALQPEAWVARRPNYDRFFRELLAQGLVPLLEWCSRSQKIVIDYPEDRLVLLAVRAIQDGGYLPLNMMLDLSLHYGVEVVDRYPGNAHSMERLIEETRSLQDQEGWVIWFENGYRLKIKGDAYVAAHRAKEGIMRENGLIQLILDEQIDDVKPLLGAEDLTRVERFETEFWHGVDRKVLEWQAGFQEVKARFGDDRKAFALEGAPQLDGHLRSAVFRAWDDSSFDFREHLVGVIGKQLSTGAKTDAARPLWGGVVWQAVTVGDD